jgi:hypothetical protein
VGFLDPSRTEGSHGALDECTAKYQRRFTCLINAVTGDVEFLVSDYATYQELRLISDESDVVMWPSFDGIRN